jgi:putative transposase
MGIHEATFYNWKKKYGGLGISELRRLKALEEENRQLKQLVADLSLDKQMLQDVYIFQSTELCHHLKSLISILEKSDKMTIACRFQFKNQTYWYYERYI